MAQHFTQHRERCVCKTYKEEKVRTGGRGYYHNVLFLAGLRFIVYKALNKQVLPCTVNNSWQVKAALTC